jgi:phosphate uptake regulator
LSSCHCNSTADGVDLRVVAAILDITKELERMGDYAKGIAVSTFLLVMNP